MNGAQQTYGSGAVWADEQAVRGLGDAFQSARATVDGAAVHYVRGGHGPTLVLLHGFPQDWYAWRRVMPRLSMQFTLVAFDLPGIGGSAPSPGGFGAVEMAHHLHEVRDGLALGPVHIAGHDLGGGVAYAYAREFPDQTDTVTVLEFPIPGIPQPADVEIDAPMWHVPFHMTADLPEALVAGRQDVYFFNQFTTEKAAIGDADIAHYAAAHREPRQLRAAFEFYRALPAAGRYNAAHTERIDVPLLLVGGSDLFGPIMPAIAENLRRRRGWTSVAVHTVEGAQHYLIEEKPAEIAELLERHATGT